MEIPTSLLWIGGILGTIILGALGSGLWNLVLEDPSKKLINTLGRISTLGIKKLQNSLYRQVARRSAFYGQQIILLLTFFFFSIGLSFVARLALHDNFKEEFRQKISQEMDAGMDIKDIKAFNQAVDEETARRLKSISKITANYLLILMAIIFNVILFETLRRITIHARIIYFDRISATAACFISYRELQGVKMRFANIKSKEDYDTLIGDLWDIISPHFETE